MSDFKGALKMLLNCAARMVQALGRQVCGVGELWGFENPQFCFLPCDAYGRPEAGTVPTYTQKSKRIVYLRLALVLHVDRVRHTPEILNSVVRRVAINVVDMFRPLAVNVQPSKSMRAVWGFAYLNLLVLFRCAATGWFPGPHAAPCNDPSKRASVWVVVKKFAQTLRGKIGLSHDAPSKRIGQRPVSVSSTCGLRYFRASAGVAP